MGEGKYDAEGENGARHGSSKGLGWAILLRLAAQGGNVVVNYSRDENAANEVRAGAEALSAGVITVAADVSGVDGIERLYDATIEAFRSGRHRGRQRRDGEGSWPVGAHSVGNSSSLPGGGHVGLLGRECSDYAPMRPTRPGNGRRL